MNRPLCALLAATMVISSCGSQDQIEQPDPRSTSGATSTQDEDLAAPPPRPALKGLLGPIDLAGVELYGQWKDNGGENLTAEQIGRLENMDLVQPREVLESETCSPPGLADLEKLVQVDELKPTLDRLGFVYFRYDPSSQTERHFFGKCLQSLPSAGGKAGLIGAVLRTGGLANPPIDYKNVISFYGEEVPTQINLYGDREQIARMKEEVTENGERAESRTFEHNPQFSQLFMLNGVYWDLSADALLRIVPRHWLDAQDFFGENQLALDDESLVAGCASVLRENPWDQLGWKVSDLVAEDGVNEGQKSCKIINHVENNVLDISLVSYEEQGIPDQRVEQIMKNLIQRGDASLRRYQLISNTADSQELKTTGFNQYGHRRTVLIALNWHKNERMMTIAASLTNGDNEASLQESLFEIANAIDSY